MRPREDRQFAAGLGGDHQRDNAHASGAEMQERQERSVEEQVRSFYDEHGWQKQSGQTFETEMFRRFPAGHADYDAGPFNRLVDAFNTYHDRLLIVGSGDLPFSHVKIAQGFRQVRCVDLSIVALALARDALGDRVELVKDI
jgi:hypothetical protein